MDHRDVYLNYVSGQWKQGSSGQWDSNKNPARPVELLGKATRSTAVDVERAIESCERAQADWACRPRPARGLLLAKCAGVLRAKAENYAKALAREQGKNLTEARAEIQQTVAALEQATSLTRSTLGEVHSAEMPGQLDFSIRAPLGVVAIITSSAAPILEPARKIAAALLEGNTVVFKPSGRVPGLAALLVRAFEEAGLPPGTLNLVFGPGATLGPVLTAHPAVRAVSFSGTRENAHACLLITEPRGARFEAETMKHGFLLVAASADLEAAADAAARGVLENSGQTRGTLKRIWVEGPAQETFTRLLADKLRAARCGDGLAEPQAVGPLASDTAFKAAMDTLADLKVADRPVLCGADRAGTTGPEAGYFVLPTLLAATSTETTTLPMIIAPVAFLSNTENWRSAWQEARKDARLEHGAIFTGNASEALTFADTVGAPETLHINCIGTGHNSSGDTLPSVFFSQRTRVRLKA